MKNNLLVALDGTEGIYNLNGQIAINASMIKTGYLQFGNSYYIDPFGVKSSTNYLKLPKLTITRDGAKIGSLELRDYGIGIQSSADPLSYSAGLTDGSGEGDAWAKYSYSKLYAGTSVEGRGGPVFFAGSSQRKSENVTPTSAYMAILENGTIVADGIRAEGIFMGPEPEESETRKMDGLIVYGPNHHIKVDVTNSNTVQSYIQFHTGDDHYLGEGMKTCLLDANGLKLVYVFYEAGGEPKTKYFNLVEFAKDQTKYWRDGY